METRPSALVAIAALSRLGAVAVLMPPDGDLAEAARIGGVSDVIADPGNLEAAQQLPLRVLVLGGGESRDLDLPEDADVVDMEQIDPDVVELPGWYRPNPGYAKDLAYVAFATVSGELVARQITNFRWALSAFGTASAANLGRGDTVYCLTPLHHQSGLLVSLGGAVVGGTRIALSRGLRPERFVHELRQYGVTVVSYTWAMLRDVIDDPSFELSTATTRSGCSSAPACRPGCGSASRRCSSPRTSSSSSRPPTGRPCWPTCPAPRSAARARPLPGGGHVELAAYDVDDDLILEDDRGFVAAGADQRGRRPARPPARADRSDRVRQAGGVRARGHLGVDGVPVPPRRRRRLLARRQPPVGDPHRPWTRLQPRRSTTPRAGSVPSTCRSPTASRSMAGTLAVTALTLRPGGSVPTADLNDGAGRARRRRAAGLRPRGAGHEAQRDLPAAARPAAGGGHSEAVALRLVSRRGHGHATSGSRSRCAPSCWTRPTTSEPVPRVAPHC